MKKRLNFCKKYGHLTSEQLKKVMFSDVMRALLGCSEKTTKTVRPPGSVSRYDPRYTVKTVKHPDSVMVWGAFSGNKGRGGLYFLPKNVTMKATNYITVLEEHLLNFWKIHQCDCDKVPQRPKNPCLGVAW